MLLSCIYGRFRLITWPVIGSDFNTFWPTLITISLFLWLMTSLYDFLTASAWDLFSSSTTLTPLDSKCVLIALSSGLVCRLKTKISFNLDPAFRVVGSFVPNIMLLFLLSLFRSRRIWLAGRWKPSPWPFSVPASSPEDVGLDVPAAAAAAGAVIELESGASTEFPMDGVAAAPGTRGGLGSPTRVPTEILWMFDVLARGPRSLMNFAVVAVHYPARVPLPRHNYLSALGIHYGLNYITIISYLLIKPGTFTLQIINSQYHWCHIDFFRGISRNSIQLYSGKSWYGFTLLIQYLKSGENIV